MVNSNETDYDFTKIKAIIDLDDCDSIIKWRLTDACNYKCDYCLRAYRNHGLDQSITSQIIEEDKKKIEHALPHIARIARELPGKVKIDLIGGEVCLFDLNELIPEVIRLSEGKIKRINITTNLSRDFTYFDTLCTKCEENGVYLGLTGSWHADYCMLDKFIEKISKLNEKHGEKCIIRAETVSLKGRQSNVECFIAECKAHNLNYFVERDLRGSKEDKFGLISDSSILKKARYKLVYDDETIKYVESRNAFVSSNNKLDRTARNGFITDGFYCRADVNYVYIEYDTHYGKRQSEYEPLLRNCCHHPHRIEDYHPLKEPTKCPAGYCSLCGHVSVAKDPNDFEKYYELSK